MIVSNDANNRASNTVTIIPLTSNTKKVYPFEVMLKIEDTGLSKHSKAQCHQIRTISKIRIKDNKAVGAINYEIMKQIEAALRLHLEF